MKYTDRLFQENKELWQDYLSHPFIKGLEKGDLDLEKFKFYMIQDYLYLLEYNKVFAIGISKTSNITEHMILTSSLEAINRELSEVHLQYMKDIGITDEDISSMIPTMTNLGYTSYMIAKAHENDIVNTLIAVLSCSWSYAYIGNKIVESNKDAVNNEFYGRWVKSYSSDGFQNSNKELMDYVNKKCANLDEDRLKELSFIFKACSIFEMKFWDMAYTIGKSDATLQES